MLNSRTDASLFPFILAPVNREREEDSDNSLEEEDYSCPRIRSVSRWGSVIKLNLAQLPEHWCEKTDQCSAKNATISGPTEMVS